MHSKYMHALILNNHIATFNDSFSIMADSNIQFSEIFAETHDW